MCAKPGSLRSSLSVNRRLRCAAALQCSSVTTQPRHEPRHMIPSKTLGRVVRGADHALPVQVKENKEKIKLNNQLPYLVGNVVEVLTVKPEEEDEEDGANVDLDSQRQGKCVVLKTSTRWVQQCCPMLRSSNVPFLDNQRQGKPPHGGLGRPAGLPCCGMSFASGSRQAWWGPQDLHEMRVRWPGGCLHQVK